MLVHHLESLYPPTGWTSMDFFNQRERKLLEAFDGFITSSPYTTAYLQSVQLGKKDIITIPPALNFQAKINREKITPPINITLVANIIERKGILPFLQSLEGRKLQNVNIKIIGSPDLSPDYTQKCAALWQGSTTVEFLGSLPHRKVIALYENTDLFLSTSFMETYGMAIQEAAAHGIPLLLLDGGNVKNHLQNGNGFLCNTMEEIIDAIEHLSHDITPLNQAKQKAALLAQKEYWTWEKAALVLYKHLL